MNVPYNNIFLTGSTGVLGSYVLKCLLEKSSANVHCLIRANSLHHALDKQITALLPYGLSLAALQALKSRVNFYLGNVSAPQFGLEQSTWSTLTRQVDCTLHMAAELNFLASYESLYAANVTPMATVLDFVRSTTNPLLGHVSSYSVRGQLKNVEFTENDCDLGQGFKHMAYPQSKFEAEKWLHAHAGADIQYMIFRPGDIFGESTSGRYPFYQHSAAGIFYNILKTMIEMQCGPDMGIFFDMTPVDYVANAILYLLGEKTAVSKTFHLVNPNNLSMRQLLQFLNQQGYPMQILPVKEYLHGIHANAFHVQGMPYRSMALDLMKAYEQVLFEDYDPHVSCVLTQQMLNNTPVSSVKSVQELLPIYLAYCTKIGYINSPQ